MAIKGCWTCRKRKVRCDDTKPSCDNCTKSRRTCEGYGMQLSWPRGGDNKRAVFVRNHHSTVRSTSIHSKMFLNTSYWDASLSIELQNGWSARNHFRTMQIPDPTYLSPISMNGAESQLLSFFNESRSLVLGPTDTETLIHFILRIGLTSSPDSNNPVMQGILALASLQLHGDTKSFPYKHRVMSAITTSVEGADEQTLLQNLIATMLLYHYELSLDSDSKGSWVTFLCTVKRIINTTPAFYKLIREEYSVFLDWIYYHEVLGEFTVRHWKVPYQGCGYAPLARSSMTLQGRKSKATEVVGCPINVLELLTQICRSAIVEPTTTEVTEMITSGKAIELEQNITSELEKHGPVSLYPRSHATMVSNLHRLACLIYVNRTYHRVSSTFIYHKRLVREGVLLLEEMETCQNAWPLFIIACEATEDDQRLSILRIFERSQRDIRRRSNHIHFIQHLVVSVWSQMDLNVDDDVDYITIINAVIGGTPFIPLFA